MLQTARRVGGTAAAVVLGPTAVVLAGGSAYVMSEHGPLGLQRSVKFWATLAPTVVEWQFLRARAWALGPQRFDLDAEKKAFHQRTAAKSLGILLSLGGIYVKLGQLVGTIGVAVFNDEYVQALAPLQDGVPPRSLEEVQRIILSDLAAAASSAALSKSLWLLNLHSRGRRSA